MAMDGGFTVRWSIGRGFSSMRSRRKRVRVLQEAILTSAEFSKELWKVFHDDLDLDGNGVLDSAELQHALTHAGASPFHIWPAGEILTLLSQYRYRPGREHAHRLY
jgi:hypothetical protein